MVFYHKMELGSVRSRSPVLKIDFHTFAYTAFI
jgi:hypothetical protein